MSIPFHVLHNQCLHNDIWHIDCLVDDNRDCQDDLRVKCQGQIYLKPVCKEVLTYLGEKSQ